VWQTRGKCRGRPFCADLGIRDHRRRGAAERA
jgi:hypothetical protein